MKGLFIGLLLIAPICFIVYALAGWPEALTVAGIGIVAYAGAYLSATRT